jgi:hypothetical protein
MAFPKRVTSEQEAPASAGEQGPGEMTMCDGANRSTRAASTASLRTTHVSPPCNRT